MNRPLCLLLAALVVAAAPALADTPIGDLHANPGVRITGTVTHVFGNEFVLEDDTGHVLVDTGPEWYRSHDFAVGEPLTVIGEMDDGDFDAFTVIRQDGSELTVRPVAGPPPWAGRD